MLLAAVMLFGLSATAYATTITNWSGIQPTGVAKTTLAIIANGTGVYDGSPMSAETARMYVDGALVPAGTFTAIARDVRTVYFYYNPQPRLSDGPHTFRVEMSDQAGKLSFREWGATIAVPPTATWLAPNANATLNNGYPAVVLNITDNTPGATLSVAGQIRTGNATGPVVATFGGTGLSQGSSSFVPTAELPPGTYYLTVTVTDAAGVERVLQGTAARRFTLVAAPAMTVLPADCLASGCHVRSGHPATGMDCASCHVQVYHENADCGDCHDPHSGSVTVTGILGSCSVCHNPGKPSVPQHTAQNVDPDHMSFCSGCHTESLLARHAVTPDGTAYPYQCSLCHETGDARVVAAVAAGDRSCGACHDVDADHGEKHTSTESCLLSCHSAEITAAHDAEITATTTGCVDCHAVKVAEVRPWDKTCDACHETTTPRTHPTPSTTHAGSDALVRDYTNNFPVRTAMSTRLYPFGCSPTPGAGQTICHDVSNLATLHQDLPDKGCSVCHSGGSAAPAGANECLTCHGTGWYSPAISKGAIAWPGSDISSSGTVVAIGGSGSDNYSTLRTSDGAASHLAFASANAEATFSTGAWWLNPNTTTVTNVQVSFRAMKLATGTTSSRMTAVIDVGGTTYLSTAAASNPSAAAYTLYTHTFATNPKTGAAWTFEDLNDPASANGLRAFGVRQTLADTANIGVTEVYVKVNTPDTAYTTAPKSGGTAHHYGNYLRSPETADGEWSSAIYTQYCYDRCHVYPNTYAYYGQVLGNPTYNPFDAYQGTQMWSSLMGDPNGNSPLQRSLTLAPIALPEGSPTLEFMTNYVLGAGDSGVVEISTDGGSSWTGLEGTSGGAPVIAFAGTAGSWRPASFDLSAYAGQSVKLRFRYTQAPTSTTAGWCIDNVSVSVGGTVLFSDDAETLKPEWDTASHWRRIQYALRWLG